MSHPPNLAVYWLKSPLSVQKIPEFYLKPETILVRFLIIIIIIIIIIITAIELSLGGSSPCTSTDKTK
jgi:hypothetical protein